MFWNNKHFNAHRAYILRQRRDSGKMETYEVSCSFDIIIIMTARRSNQSILKEISPEYSWKDWCWSWTPILWPPDTNNWLIGKDPNARKDWRQEEKGTTEDEMVGWHHRLYGSEFEQALGVGDGQGSLACYSPWGCKELHMTAWRNWTRYEEIQGLRS